MDFLSLQLLSLRGKTVCVTEKISMIVSMAKARDAGPLREQRRALHYLAIQVYKE